MIGLKPCPFCGKEPKLHVESDIRMDRQRTARVVCIDCKVSLNATSREEAKEKWNKRVINE